MIKHYIQTKSYTTTCKQIEMGVIDLSAITRRKKERRSIGRFKREGYLSLYLMMLPVIAILIIFKYIPMNGVLIAFQDYNIFDGILGSEFIGLDNFRLMFSESDFLRALRNTFVLNLYKMCFYIPLPIIVALMLNEIGKRLRSFIQTVLYLPHFFSWVIVGGIFVSILSVNSGLVNQWMKSVGGEPVKFLFDSGIFLNVLVFSAMWKEIGWGSIVYVSAIASIDPEIYEAARIDGASLLQQMIRITIPNISSTIVLMTLMSLANILGNSFEQVLVMYNPAVYDVADIINTYVYRMGVNNMQYGYASAVGLFNGFVGFLFLISANYLCRKFLDKSIW